MLWNLFMGLCGGISGYVLKNKLDIDVFSVKGICILLIICTILVFIKYLVIN